jgi:hypothetical protein
MLRGVGGLGGRMAGNLVGYGDAGASAGRDLGAAISKWLGAGDYVVGSNSLVSSVKASGSIPMMHKTEQSIIVRHKEFIGSVRGSQDFVVRYALPINPGMAVTFPWLSAIAGNFQQYRVRGMVYHYVPTSGSAVASTNNALGSVMMQTSYRASDLPPTAKVTMLNEYWSNEAMPSEAFAHPIECNPDENPFNIQYVRQKAVPTEDNRLLYDLGTTYVAVQGQQISDVILGDLWVTYEIELKKPVIESNVISQGEYVGFNCTGNTADNFFGNFTRSYGDLANFGPTSTPGQLEILPGASGYYVVYIQLNITSGSITGPVTWIVGGGITFTNCSQAFTPTGNTRNELSLPAGTYTTTIGMIAFALTKPDAATRATIQLPPIAAAAGAPTYNVRLHVWRADSLAAAVPMAQMAKML